ASALQEGEEVRVDLVLVGGGEAVTVPGVGGERPAVAEADGLSLPPVLERDLRAVARRDRAHGPASVPRSTLRDRTRASQAARAARFSSCVHGEPPSLPQAAMGLRRS